MKKLIESAVLASNLSKTLVYSIEYRMLYGLAKGLSFYVQPPTRERDPELLRHLGEGVVKLHWEDGRNVAEGFYPFDVVKPRGPRRHLENLPRLLVDSLRISRRRRLNLKRDFDADPGDVPDYMKRNFHFQTDGYFSEASARLYEHQVEVLFSGTAAPMRRMLIRLLKEKFTLNRPLRILELAAGTGAATLDFAKSFRIARYTVSDASADYLKLARERLPGEHFDFVQAPAEKLPFADGSFDLVFSVYLFHELPRAIREEVLRESFRVLAPGGVVGVCDSIQRDDDPKLNGVLEQFPVDYHEPFYKDYTLWDTREALAAAGFREITGQHRLLSKYWVALKRE
jgi:ubiquinone/menaquinone biosynthesis C-methylase UbiE